MMNVKLSVAILLWELLFHLVPLQAADDYKCEVEIKPDENVVMSGDGDKAVLDKQEGKSYKFKAVAKFVPDSEREWIEYQGGKTRKYTWEPEPIMTSDPPKGKGGFSSTGICSPTEEYWGTEFKVKVKVRMGLVGPKKKVEEAEDEMDTIAPLIQIQSAKFSENAEGNGFTIHDQFRGNPVPVPEFKRDDKTPDDDKIPHRVLCSKVHNPVPYNAGPTNKSESNYIKDDLKCDENRSNFTEPGGRRFSFNK